MAERTTTQTTEKDRSGNQKETTTQTERVPSAPANPTQGQPDTAKRGPGSGTNPTGVGGNEESVSG